MGIPDAASFGACIWDFTEHNVNNSVEKICRAALALFVPFNWPMSANLKTIHVTVRRKMTKKKMTNSYSMGFYLPPMNKKNGATKMTLSKI